MPSLFKWEKLEDLIKNVSLFSQLPAIFQALSKDPDENQENGNTNAIGDYSDTGDGVTDFCITAQPKYIYLLNRMLIYVEDAGSFDSGSYGNGITLTNGVNLINGAPGLFEEVITKAGAIKKNPEWEQYVGIDTKISKYGSGNETLSAMWTFEHMGRPVFLDGAIGEYACIRLNDDFTGLIKHKFHVQGVKVPRYLVE